MDMMIPSNRSRPVFLECAEDYPDFTKSGSLGKSNNEVRRNTMILVLHTQSPESASTDLRHVWYRSRKILPPKAKRRITASQRVKAPPEKKTSKREEIPHPSRTIKRRFKKLR
jgi:hypothetical protein